MFGGFLGGFWGLSAQQFSTDIGVHAGLKEIFSKSASFKKEEK
jgi:hypothetical protein